jgi:hypothetical protein
MKDDLRRPSYGHCSSGTGSYAREALCRHDKAKAEHWAGACAPENDNACAAGLGVAKRVPRRIHGPLRFLFADRPR